MTTQKQSPNPVQSYQRVKQLVIDVGYDHEIKWQATRDIEKITEQEFLQELAWVVLSSGMRVSVVQQKFPGIREAFYQFNSAQDIAEHQEYCIEAAARHFNNKPKLRAIASAAYQVNVSGWGQVKHSIIMNPLARLQMFPYIGPITVYHLAKNIGVQVAKPDRHLQRIAAYYGFYLTNPNTVPDVQGFCQYIHKHTDDPIPVIDIVWWRYATLEPDYLEKLGAL